MALSALEHASIHELAGAMAAGSLSARELTRAYLERIGRFDGSHNAVIEVNPAALAIATALDDERARGDSRGPLHGIPILLKDNLDTADDMQTAAGSLALVGAPAARDSTVVARLRAAGAVILGKTNLSEWANFRSTRSSSGWSSRGGQTRNAHDPVRTPGGSSSGSGVAVALGLCAAAVGTETDGSVVVPAAMNGVVGFKPGIGRVSRAGIIPLAVSQDTAGPMTRSVGDAHTLLMAMTGSDPRDPSTRRADAARKSLVVPLDDAALAGVRLGVARSCCGYHDRLDACFEDTLDALRAAGARVVDPVHLPAADRLRPHEQVVMETEFGPGLARYLATRSPASGITDLQSLVAFNDANRERVMPYFGQERLQSSLGRGGLADPAYHHARATCLQLAVEEGIERAMADHGLAAIIAPTTTPAWLIDWVCGDNRRGGAACVPAVAGYPHATVPMGFVEGLPVGLSFIGGARGDRRVLELAHAFERHTAAMRPPVT